MKLWYSIRRPVGFLLGAALCAYAVIIIHVIPVVIANWILGI